MAHTFPYATECSGQEVMMHHAIIMNMVIDRFNPLPVRFFSTHEMDGYITAGGILIRDLENTTEEAVDAELKLIDTLTLLLEKRFGEADTFVSDDIWATQSFSLEISESVLSKRFLDEVLVFLLKNEARYWVICAVYDVLTRRTPRSQFLGRFVMSSHEIVIEASIGSLWKEKINDCSEFLPRYALH